MNALQLKLNEPTEVLYHTKAVGYLFKISQEQIVLCQTEEFNPTKLISINPKDIVDAHQFTDAIPIASQKPQDAPGDDQEEPKGNLLQFPVKPPTDDSSAS